MLSELDCFHRLLASLARSLFNSLWRLPHSGWAAGELTKEVIL
jgi:hypothetical protein